MPVVFSIGLLTGLHVAHHCMTYQGRDCTKTVGAGTAAGRLYLTMRVTVGSTTEYQWIRGGICTKGLYCACCGPSCTKAGIWMVVVET
mmetsp:Transcript_87812/g.243579  ORF Transcript_87812/g.243579 Transcript_87812/m.243579 type:complete len:88 (+) Transcript_87812:79-342(+)